MDRPTLDQFIARYANWERMPCAGGTLHSGRTFRDCLAFYDRVPAGFVEREAWGDGQYRLVWVGEADRATITYCEGDIQVWVGDEAAFRAQLADAAEFYGRGGGSER